MSSIDNTIMEDPNVPVKTKRGRSNKNMLYHDQRVDILNHILAIIKLDNKSSVLLPDLENNNELIQYLLNSIDDIKKYYTVGGWGYFISKNRNRPTSEITILREIFKDNDYTIFRKPIYNNTTKKAVTRLFFIKY